MPLESVAEWRARIGSSWCTLGRPFKSRSGRPRTHRVLSQDQVETMMMMLSISLIHWLLFDLPVLCLLDWQSAPNLPWKKTNGSFTFISGKKVFKRRMIILIRDKAVITTLETLSMASNLIGTLLLMSGDVELNPGPVIDYESVDSNQELDGSNMLDVLELLLPHQSRYYNIGIGLRLSIELLDEIEEKFDSDPCKALRKVVGFWLQKKYDVSRFGLPTWQMLVKAIDNPAGGNDHRLAEKIALDHPAATHVQQPIQYGHKEGDGKSTNKIITSDHFAGESHHPSHSSEAKEEVEIQNEDSLSSNNMREVLDLTWEYRASWKIIGIELGMSTGTLDAIDKNNHHKVEDCLVELLSKWLRHKATRSAMTKALQSTKVTAEATSAQAHENKLVEYAKYLKSLYKAKFQASSSQEQWPPPPTKKIFRLAMKKSKEKLRKGHIDDDFVRQKTIAGKVDGEMQHKLQIELKDIFRDIDYGEQKKVLMEGAPGCGKSTLSLHICQQWAHGKLFQEYKLAILVKLRDFISETVKSLADLLPRLTNSIGQGIATDITTLNGEGVLFVLDGWDELPKTAPGYTIILSLIEGTQLQECSIIITSRPTSSTILQPLVCLRTEILGFTKIELRRFFCECLDDDTKAVDSLLRRVKVNPVVEGCCYLPLNASILVHLFKYGNHVLPTTQYGIFSKLICNCILRDLKRTMLMGDISEINSLDNLPVEIDGPFQHICELAYRGVVDDQVIFDLGPHFNTIGLLQGVESFALCGKSHSYNFLHLTVQEVLAARHIARKLGESEQTDQFIKLFDNPRFTAVFQFYAAITKLRAPGISEIVVQVAKSGNKARLLSLLHCLYEAQDPSLCHLVAQQLNSQLDLIGTSLSPADCFSLGYFMTFSKDFNYYLNMCTIDDDGCKALFRDGQVYHLRILSLNSNFIGDEGAKALSEAVKKMPNLQKLYLSQNPIGDKGAMALSEAVKKMPNLQQLNLELNRRISDVVKATLGVVARQAHTTIYMGI